MLAETTVSDLVEKYNQAYAILVKSFGKPDKGNTAEQLLTQEDFEMYYTSNDVSALWYYDGHTIILKAEGTIGTYSQPITDYALVSYFRYAKTRFADEAFQLFAGLLSLDDAKILGDNKAIDAYKEYIKRLNNLLPEE